MSWEQIESLISSRPRKSLVLVLKNSRKNIETELRYRIQDTPVGRKFVNIMSEVIGTGQLETVDNLGFVGSREEAESVIATLSDIVRKLNEIYDQPFDTEKLSLEKVDQAYLNYLHEGFEHYYHRIRDLREIEAEPVTEDLMCQLNRQVHLAEAFVWNKGLTLDDAFFFMNVLMMPRRMAQIQDADYAYFTPELSAGTLYAGYYTTGKNLYHAFTNDDVRVIKNRMLAPQIRMGCEVFTVFQDMKFPWKRFHQWCDEVELEKYGYDRSDPRNGMGFCVLGQLERPVDRELRQRLCGVDRVVGVDLVS